MEAPYKTIDEYINGCPPETQGVLKELRNTIKQACPDATEKIGWSMPSFWQNGYIIHFMLHKKHIGVYPGPEVLEVLKDKLVDYKSTKGGFQIPLGTPIPHDLIKEIVEYNLKNRIKP